jgi:hypothetical protein
VGGDGVGTTGRLAANGGCCNSIRCIFRQQACRTTAGAAAAAAVSAQAWLAGVSEKRTA